MLWEGLTCNDEDTYIERIDLHGMGLRGSLPDDLFSSLQTVVRINFERNSISGQIPSSLQALSMLQVFDVNSNKMQGTIPTFICDLALKSLELG